MAVLDMTPAVLDIVGVRAGDSNTRSFKLSADGQPWDLTGMTVTAQARKKHTDPDPPALTAAITMTGAALGEFLLSWPGDQVTALLGAATAWAGVWDLQVRSGSDLPVTVLAGKFQCAADVTRP